MAVASLQVTQRKVEELITLVAKMQEKEEPSGRASVCLMCNQKYGYPGTNYSGMVKLKAECGCKGAGECCANANKGTKDASHFDGVACGLKPLIHNCFRCSRALVSK